MISFQNHTTLSIQGDVLDEKALTSWAEEQILSLEEWRKEIGAFILEWLNEEDFVIVHTSGSTGEPKPIRILKEQMIQSALATGHFFSLQAGQKALLCLPGKYIAGKMMLVRALVLGMDLYICPPENPFLDLEVSIDFAAMVPLQVRKLLEQKANFALIQQLIIGGAAVSFSLQEKLQNISTQCFATYGMTETVTHIAIQRLNGRDKSSHYHTLPHVSISKDKRDCLVIQAPRVATGTVVTNDVVDIINANTFRWLCRFDNIINTGGVKVMPELIEQKLSSLIATPFFVSSIPDEKLGQKIILVVETPTPSLKVKSLLEFEIQKKLTTFEKPRGIFYIKKMKKSASGKILRKQTLQTIKSLI